MGQLTKVEQNRQTLSTVLSNNTEYVRSMIPLDKEDEFKNNFLELAQNGYLMEQIPPKEVLVTALNATKLGLNVNPIYKELYVLPFNVKGKGMVASIVIPKQGHAQIAYDAGFFLDISNVFNLNGKVVSEKDMSREEQISINTTDEKWVDEHLLGWDISLVDISNNEIKVPTQTKFIEVAYAREVTKGLQDTRFKIQSWTHKAVRRAMGDFFIPKHRRNMIIEEVEAFNVTNEKENSNETVSTQKEASSKATTFDISKDSVEPEAIEADIEEVTIDTINAFYKEADKELKGKITGVLPQDWRSKSSDDLAEIYETLKAL